MRTRILGILGWIYILAGLLCNPWVLGRVVSPDGNIGSARVFGLILLLEAIAIGFGLLTLLRRNSNLVLNLNLFVVSFGLAGPLLGELFLRASIALHIKAVRDPALYGDYFSDDIYWKLVQDWDGKYKYASPEGVHPILGWSQGAVTHDSPLGLVKESQEGLVTEGTKILFYGDSFVRGGGDRQHQLPVILREQVPAAVVDLSVGSYGFDQVYLMFQQTVKHASGGLVLVGVLVSDDLDRMILKVRMSQKPYFVVTESGELALKGVPVQRDQEQFFRSLHIPFHSYLFTFLRKKIGGTNLKIAEKMAISNRLLDRFAEEARGAGAELGFVLFYAKEDLVHPTWRETFLRQSLDARQLRYLDTKPVLLRAAQSRDVPLDAFYEVEGHHNNLGNEVMGAALVAWARTSFPRFWQAVPLTPTQKGVGPLLD
jgi:hypothetical protein